MKSSFQDLSRRKKILALYLAALGLLLVLPLFFTDQEGWEIISGMIRGNLHEQIPGMGLVMIHFNLMGLFPLLYLFAIWPQRTAFTPKLWWFWPFTFVAGAFILVPWYILRERRFEPVKPYLSELWGKLWLGLFLVGTLGVVASFFIYIDVMTFFTILKTQPFFWVMSLDLLLFGALILYETRIKSPKEPH